MKRRMILALSSALLLVSCGTYMGTGTYVGAQMGGMLGSAIGGITGGGHGSSIGSILGMASGAAIGGAIGNAKDKSDYQEMRNHYAAIQQQKELEQEKITLLNNNNTIDYESYYSEGDDVIYDFEGDNIATNYSSSVPQYRPKPPVVRERPMVSQSNLLRISRLKFEDRNRDNTISSNERCRIIFEITNTSSKTLRNIDPIVSELNDNKQIFVSPTMRIRSIAPGKTVRYTADIKAKKVNTGHARFCVYAMINGKRVSQMQQISVAVRRR